MSPKRIVYLLNSATDAAERYIGITSDLKRRVTDHNAGRSAHTSKHRDWQIHAAFWFEDAERASAFERYLKSGSGRAFANRHFW